MSTAKGERSTTATRAEAAGAATSALYEQYGTRVYRFCLSRLGDREEAADAVQDTFTKAWLALRRGCVVRQPLPWLLTIAGNVCVSRHRALRAHGRDARLPDDAVSTAGEPPTHELAGLRSALRALPDGQRRAFVLRELRGCSYGEISLHLGVSYASVAALLHRSRQAVAARLSGAGRSVLAGFPLPGMLRSAFDAGGASVAATAAGTVLLVVAPQLPTVPPRSLPRPAPVDRPPAATVVAGAAAALPASASETPSAPDEDAAPYRARDGDAIPPSITTRPPASPPERGGATNGGFGEVAPPAPVPGESRSSDAPAGAHTPDAPGAAPPSEPGGTATAAGAGDPGAPGETPPLEPVDPGDVPSGSPGNSGAHRNDPRHTQSAAEPKESGPPDDPGNSGAHGNGPPDHAGVGGSGAQGNGQPDNPGNSGNQGNGPPAHAGASGTGAQGDGQPDNPGNSTSQGSGPPTDPDNTSSNGGAQRNGSSGNPGTGAAQGNGPPADPGNGRAQGDGPPADPGNSGGKPPKE